MGPNGRFLKALNMFELHHQSSVQVRESEFAKQVQNSALLPFSLLRLRLHRIHLPTKRHQAPRGVSAEGVT